MPLANVANTETFQTWLTRTNQLVVGLNSLLGSDLFIVPSSNSNVFTVNANVGIFVTDPDVKLRIKGDDVPLKGQILIDSTNFGQMSFYNTNELYGRIYVNTSGINPNNNVGMGLVTSSNLSIGLLPGNSLSLLVTQNSIHTGSSINADPNYIHSNVKLIVSGQNQKGRGQILINSADMGEISFWNEANLAGRIYVNSSGNTLNGGLGLVTGSATLPGVPANSNNLAIGLYPNNRQMFVATPFNVTIGEGQGNSSYVLSVVGNAHISSETLLVGNVNVLSAIHSTNGWANFVGTSANSYASSMVGVGGGVSIVTVNLVGAASNAWANLVGSAANTRSDTKLSNTTATLNGTLTATSNVYAKSTLLADTGLIVGGLNIGAENGNINRLINGDFRIWQRGTSFSPSTYTVNTAYTADRWKANRGSLVGSSMTVSRSSVTFLNCDRYAMRVQRNSGDSFTGGLYNVSIIQQIESENCRDLGGQNVTLSFWARKGSGLSGTLVAGLYTGTGTDENIFSSGVFTGETGVFVQSFAGLTTSFAKYTVTGTMPNNINEARISFSFDPSDTAGASDWFEIIDVQLEKGGYLTEFERRNYTEELSMCERYYVTGRAYNSIDSDELGDTVYLPTTMRSAPTISSTRLAGASGTPTIYASYDRGFMWTLTNSSSNFYDFSWIAQAEI